MRLFKTQSGFSLTEVLVVLGIFAVTITLTLDIFLTLSIVQKRAVREQELENNTQLFINTLNFHLRNTSLSYEFYDDYLIEFGEDLLTDLPTHVLAIESQFGITVFRKSGEVGSPWSGTGSDLEMCFSGFTASVSCLDQMAEWDSFSYNDTEIEDLKFYLMPGVDPFIPLSDGTYESNQQPMVTVVIATSSLGAREGEDLNLVAQSTFSLKNYQR